MTKQRLNKIVFILFVLFLCTVSAVNMLVHIPVRADTKSYSGVLDDLRKDAEFNVSDYPTKFGDYSLQVKQIAESENGELFIYVYQPGGQSLSLVATSINISTTLHINKQFKSYDLELLNSTGTLFKYKVKDFEVKKDAVRYYDISSIFRKWINNIDGKPENDNTISEKVFAVGQLWTACTVKDEVTYSCEDVEVLDVTKQFVHFLRYDDGFAWSGYEFCDAHFFAFSCDHKIDKLLSADLEFYTQSYKRLEGQDYKLNEDKEYHFVTVDSTMQGASKKETWQRMSSVSEFLAENDVPKDEAEKLRNYDWIINFYETEYERDLGGKDILIDLLVPGGFIWSIVNACTTNGVLVTDVSLMRLEFEYEGKIYNLGVVSDKQTGSWLPPIPDGIFDNVPWWVWTIVISVVVIIALLVLSIFFPIVGKAFKGLWRLICLPFRKDGDKQKEEPGKPKKTTTNKSSGKKRSTKK